MICAGMEVQTVACDDSGNVSVEDLQKKAKENADRLAALVVTYPSTHGVFEESIRDVRTQMDGQEHTRTFATHCEHTL